MSPFNQEHIEVEPFDREYTLEELLPKKLLARIGPPWDALIPVKWAICTEKGVIHFNRDGWRNPPGELLSTTLAQGRPRPRFMISGPGDVCLVLFSIEYELEIKGFLAIDAAGRDRETLDRMGGAGVRLLQQLMRLRHQTMMTSGLHGQVVEESYAQLKDKAVALARSEEKYRQLAANLEIEVQKKTEEIRLAHARLINQEKLAAIGQLSAGMAHEINNPLGFIISNLDTLAGYAADLTSLVGHYRQLVRCCDDHQDTMGTGPWSDLCRTAEQLENELDGDFLLADIPTLAKESMSGAQRIQKIVSDLKIVARPGETDPEPINVHAGIDAVLTILANRIGEKINVQRAYGPVPLVPGHPQEINQVWLNLILNALEAMDGQGTLGIETRTSGRDVLVMVSDTGKGITPDVLPNIFEPFFTTKAIGQGMGLGLHLSYQVISKHGGRIDVESASAKGSRFTVCLPATGSA